MPDRHTTWRRRLLSASVILNLFFAAMIAGHLWRTQVDRPPGGTPLMRALTNAEHNLSPADAAKFRTVLRRDAPSYFAASLQLARARHALEAQVTSDPFSPADARTAFLNWQVAFQNFTQDFRAPLIDALANISADGRHRLVAQRQAESPPITP